MGYGGVLYLKHRFTGRSTRSLAEQPSRFLSHQVYHTMSDASRVQAGLDLLHRIGEDLHRGIFPVVYRSGRVEPFSVGTSPPSLKEVRKYGQGQQGGPPAGPRQGAAAWEGSAGGSAAAYPAASLLGDVGALRSALGDEFVDAYPQVRAHNSPGGPYFSLSVQPVEGLGRFARLLFRLGAKDQIPKAWGWWDDGTWIGPRHTNFPDGSICAFEMRDGTWLPGLPFSRLVDLWVLWVTRHLHLQAFGWWPGAQALHTPFERLAEHQPGELCGCGSGRLYVNCCRAEDEAIPSQARLREFVSVYRGGRRRPPVEVVELAAW